MVVVGTDDKNGIVHLSEEGAGEFADAMMAILLRRLGRSPTLAEIQEAIAEIGAAMHQRLLAEEGAVISSGAPTVEGVHDDAKRTEEGHRSTAPPARPR